MIARMPFVSVLAQQKAVKEVVAYIVQTAATCTHGQWTWLSGNWL